MCDVENPLYGPTGAAYVFGPQKGADEAMVERLDQGLRHLARVVERDLKMSIAQIPGAGAAGGMGGGCLAFLGAELKSGILCVICRGCFLCFSQSNKHLPQFHPLILPESVQTFRN